MRIFLSILITVFLLTGTYFYTRFADSVRREAVVWQPQFAAGNYSIEIGRTFDCVPDDLFEAPAIEVVFRGQSIFSRNETVPADEPIRIENVPNVEEGENDFVVSANLMSAAGSLAAMRVRVFRDNAEIANRLVADSPDLSSISATVPFSVPAVSSTRLNESRGQ